MTHIGLLEDDALTRASLSAAFQAMPDVELVIATRTPGDLIETARSSRLDVIVCDLHIGAGPTGIEVAHAVRRVAPAVGVVFLTNFEDPRLLDGVSSPLPSASEYLVKRDVSDLEIIREAIRRALKGAESRVPRSPSKADRALTDHQLDILRLVAQGLSNKEIAKQRHVSEKSVEQTINRLAKSLDLAKTPSANQRVHLARAYFRALGVPLP